MQPCPQSPPVVGSTFGSPELQEGPEGWDRRHDHDFMKGQKARTDAMTFSEQCGPLSNCQQLAPSISNFSGRRIEELQADAKSFFAVSKSRLGSCSPDQN